MKIVDQFNTTYSSSSIFWPASVHFSSQIRFFHLEYTVGAVNLYKLMEKQLWVLVGSWCHQIWIILLILEMYLSCYATPLPSYLNPLHKWESVLNMDEVLLLYLIPPVKAAQTTLFTQVPQQRMSEFITGGGESRCFRLLTGLAGNMGTRVIYQVKC